MFESTDHERVIMSVLWISFRAPLASKLMTTCLQDKVTGLAVQFEAVVLRALGLQLASASAMLHPQTPCKSSKGSEAGWMLIYTHEQD
jgi:hypothetical protein